MTRDRQPSLTLRRKRDRQSHDPAVLRSILAEGLVAHVGLVRGEVPIVLPYLYGVGDLGAGPVMLLHGSTGGGLFLEAGDAGVLVSATVTHLDGLVFARSTFDSSANYRSAMVHGRATVVPTHLRERALWLISDHLMPGRRAEVRETTRKEAQATQVLQLSLQQASVKVRFDGAGDASDDGEDRAVWAGVLPLATRAGAPIPSGAERGAPVDPSVLAFAHRLDEAAQGRWSRLRAKMAAPTSDTRITPSGGTTRT